MTRYSHPLYLPGLQGPRGGPHYAGGDVPTPGSPNKPSVLIQHRGQIQGGQRGTNLIFCPQTTPFASFPSQTTQIAMRADAPGTPIPNWAAAALIIVSIASNTNSDTPVYANFHNQGANSAVTGITGGTCVGSVTLALGTTNKVERGQLLVPLVGGKITWETVFVAPGGNYDINLFLSAYLVS